MIKPGEILVCNTCGFEVVCIEGCRCKVCPVICCGKPMKKKIHKKSKKK